MPESKKRHPHQPQQQHHDHPGGKKTSKAALVSMVFFAIIGMGISFFAVGDVIKWLAVGAIVGAILGYFFGHSIDKTLSKK